MPGFVDADVTGNPAVASGGVGSAVVVIGGDPREAKVGLGEGCARAHAENVKRMSFGMTWTAEKSVSASTWCQSPAGMTAVSPALSS